MLSVTQTLREISKVTSRRLLSYGKLSILAGRLMKKTFLNRMEVRVNEPSPAPMAGLHWLRSDLLAPNPAVPNVWGAGASPGDSGGSQAPLYCNLFEVCPGRGMVSSPQVILTFRQRLKTPALSPPPVMSTLFLKCRIPAHTACLHPNPQVVLIHIEAPGTAV